jgi:hypothetical protein
VTRLTTYALIELGCYDFYVAGIWPGNCCVSCHEDELWGYPLLEIEPEDSEDGREAHVYASVCCAFKRFLKERGYPLTRDEWARALWARHERYREQGEHWHEWRTPILEAGA